MWSVVTPVPAGTHEFKFVVDGEWKHSTRHPTVGEDEETMNNIRVIRGPPKNKQNTARLSEQRNKDAGMAPPKQKKCCVVCYLELIPLCLNLLYIIHLYSNFTIVECVCNLSSMIMDSHKLDFRYGCLQGQEEEKRSVVAKA